jgi:uncharacterized protein (TIGR03083 family)
MNGVEQHGKNAPQADHIRFLFDPGAVLVVLAEHRRRFGSTVATLSVEELETPSRCQGWTVADVLRHGVWVDATMRRIWSGDESIAEAFDPRTTPNEWVQADRAVPDEEIRQRYLSSTETMIIELETADPERWGHPSLSPAGRVPWWLSAVHIGWDSTVHERDALFPLDRAVEVVSDETMLTLAYSLVLASFFDGPDPLNVQIDEVRFRSGNGPVTAWKSTADTKDNDGNLGPAEAATVLTGDPVAIIDGLCGRTSPTDALHGDAVVIERVGGLARFFTSRPSTTWSRFPRPRSSPHPVRTRQDRSD